MTENIDSGTYAVSTHRGIVFLLNFFENLNLRPLKKKHA